MKNKLQLPHTFKKIGWILIVISLITSFTLGIIVSDEVFQKQLIFYTNYGFLIGLFIVSISKDTVEDEFIKSIRMQSYMFAFLIVIIFTLLSPFLILALKRFTDDSPSILSYMNSPSDFSTLKMLLIAQIIAFRSLKKKANEE